MIVKCITVSPQALKDRAERLAYKKYMRVSHLPLELLRTYVVYGIQIRAGAPWFLVMEDGEDEYPRAHLAGFFEIVDERLPADWKVSRGGNHGTFSILPGQWADDSEFMEKLVDGECSAIMALRELQQKYEC